MKLNLGAGRDVRDGYVNHDLVALPGIDEVFDLTQFPWPWRDKQMEEIVASDILEHLPNFLTHVSKSLQVSYQAAIPRFMEECWRIMCNGATLFIQVPDGRHPNWTWCDPTHVRGFMPDSFDYWDPDKPYGKTYGYLSPPEVKFTIVDKQEYNYNLGFTLVKR